MGSNSKQRREAKKKKAIHQNKRRDADDRAGSARPDPAGQRPPNAGPSTTPPRPQEGRDDAARAHNAFAEAIIALERSDNPALERALDELAFLPRGGGPRAGCTLTEARILSFVRALWSHGWQPRDLAHIVGRELGAAHRTLAVEAIAIDHASAKHAYVDPRWVAQLAAIGAIDDEDHVPPSTAASERASLFSEDDLPPVASQRTVPRTLFPEAADRSTGAERFMIADLRVAIELCVLIIGLPQLATHITPPGQRPTGPMPRTNSASRLDDKILTRVRGLLAKAESTTFEAEADALTAKAQELMARHAIDLAMLDSRAPNRDAPSARRIHFDDPYIDAKSQLLTVVSRENRVSAVFSTGLGFSTIMGFESDLDIVELLFTSLLTQATSAMVAEGKTVDHYGRSTTRSFRQSFLVSFAHRIGERLREANVAAAADARSEMGDVFLPVLADRKVEVDDFVTQVFPRTVSRSVNASNGAGWAAGRTAADRASIKVAEQIGKGR
jgi:hypothetical protein